MRLLKMSCPIRIFTSYMESSMQIPYLYRSENGQVGTISLGPDAIAQNGLSHQDLYFLHGIFNADPLFISLYRSEN